MSKGSTVTVDLPPENHQKDETSKKPESTPPDLNNYCAAERFYGFLLKFITFIATLRVQTSIYESIDNCLDLISERPWLGSILIVPFILWIPAIILVWYSLGTKTWKFLLPYIIYGAVFYYIDAILYVYIFFQSTSMEEVFSNPKVREVAYDFTTKRMASYAWCPLLCYIHFEVAKIV